MNKKNIRWDALFNRLGGISTYKKNKKNTEKSIKLSVKIKI
jgi:hypothetical protein